MGTNHDSSEDSQTGWRQGQAARLGRLLAVAPRRQVDVVLEAAADEQQVHNRVEEDSPDNWARR